MRKVDNGWEEKIIVEIVAALKNKKLQKIALRKKLYTKSTLHKKHIAQKSLNTKGKMNEVTSQTSFITQLDSQVNVNSYLVDLDEKLLGSENLLTKMLGVQSVQCFNEQVPLAPLKRVPLKLAGYFTRFPWMLQDIWTPGSHHHTNRSSLVAQY